MLKANKSAWCERIFDVYNRNLIRRRFASFNVEGMEFLRASDAKIPLLIYANHSSWWDGLVMYRIFRLCALDGYVMMEEKQLKNLRLFRRLGAFSVVRENARQAAESCNYAAWLLKQNAARAVLIFPQGEIRPNEARPLKFFRGAAKIIEKTGDCATVPAALHYEFSGNFKPEIFVKIGAAEIVRASENRGAKNLTERFEQRLTDRLDDLKTEIAAEKIAGYKNII